MIPLVNRDGYGDKHLSPFREFDCITDEVDDDLTDAANGKPFAQVNWTDFL